jgi:predicted RNA-binding Zn-ribbon protein involved in translation (DUF1610 family)
MPWKQSMSFSGPNNAKRLDWYFACDNCGSIRFKKNARIFPTSQRCKKCGAEYAAPKSRVGKPAWKRTS